MNVDRIFKSTVLLAALVLTASFGFGQNTADSITIPAKTISKESVSEPTIFIGDGTGGKKTKEALLANPFVIAKDFKYDEIEWSVLSYKVTFVVNGREEAPITVNGAEFNDQVKSRIQSASSGTIIEFSDIKIQSIAGKCLCVKVFSVRIQ
jgi:hypothetical protein